MDYSLLLGVHDCEQAEQDNMDRPEQPDFGAAEDSYNEDDEDSGGSTVAVGAPTGPTPPDSPQMSRMRAARSMSYQYTGQIIPELDIYAISCKEDDTRREVYFLALIDILTHYGVKKQAAKAAKTVKYGSHVDGISTVEPEQYGRRFLDFMAKVIEWNRLPHRSLFSLSVPICFFFLIVGSMNIWFVSLPPSQAFCFAHCYIRFSRYFLVISFSFY